MNDVECPYCENVVEINHDGYGLEEGVFHNQECPYCEKYFVYQTIITFNYDTYKADCLNGSEHEFKYTTTFPMEFTEKKCIYCGEREKLLPEEIEKLKNQNYE